MRYNPLPSDSVSFCFRANNTSLLDGPVSDRVSLQIEAKMQRESQHVRPEDAFSN